MFDEIWGTASLYAGGFRDSVRDSFGASIVDDVLDPILKEISSLRILNATVQQQSLGVDQILAGARMLQYRDIENSDEWG